MSQITLTEALVQLKNLNSKIEDAQRRVFIGFTQVASNKLPAGYQKEEDYLRAVQGSIDTPLDLIRRRDQLKAKLALANALTKVKVGKEEMSIAEAIERKNSLKYKLSLLNIMKQQKQVLDNQTNNHNAQLSVKADAFVTAMYGNNSSASTEERAKSRELWIENNSAKLLTDPKVETTLRTLEEEINDFQSNVDVALSVVNAKTVIDVE